METRVRFAPSPTGYLHVGGLRTALYNYLFAKHNNGKIVLRIEDTDRTRYVEDATEKLIAALRWAGIEFDESLKDGGDHGPYVQSERNDIYSEHIKKLLDSGNAYYAFDSTKEIEKMREDLKKQKKTPKYDRNKGKNSTVLSDDEVKNLMDEGTPYVIRLKVPEDKEVSFNDLIRGEIKVHTSEVDDQILIKSDGYPTYHLANVVDDHLMKISHVIRGEEWLPSTPKHVILYEAFGWDVPEFAHLPLLLNKDKTKLSKRHGSVAVEDFINKGYQKEAFVNFIALLGWNPSGDQEIYGIKELIEKFEITKVNKAGAVFDLSKLNWMNQQYLKETPSRELLPKAQQYMAEAGFDDVDDSYLSKIIDILKDRIEIISEIPEYAPYFFTEDFEYDKEAIEKSFKDDTYEMTGELNGKFEELDNWEHDEIKSAVKALTKEKGIKMGKIMKPLRLAVTGQGHGASMFDTLEILGHEKVTSRIKRFLDHG